MSQKGNTRPHQICTRCVMDTTDPEIVFDENGVCNHCHTYDEVISRYVFSGKEGERKLSEIVTKIKEAGKNKKYDCVIGVSGGVDSTYVAYIVKQLGLRPLAVHLDNGWDSELAVKNIENTLRILNIELYTHVINWMEFRDLQLSFLRASTPDSEIPSDHAIVAMMCLMARKIGVKYLIAGYNLRTETHLPPAWSQGHLDWKYIRSVHKQFGQEKLKTYPHVGFLRSTYDRFYLESVNILNYIDYSKKEAMPILEQNMGWTYYGGKHYESIYTRWYQGYWLPKKFGFDKRRTHLSALICSGEITSSEAIGTLKMPTYDQKLQEEDTAYVVKKLGLTNSELEEIMRLPQKSYWDYPSNGKLFKNSIYLALQRIYRMYKWRN